MAEIGEITDLDKERGWKHEHQIGWRNLIQAHNLPPELRELLDALETLEPLEVTATLANDLWQYAGVSTAPQEILDWVRYCHDEHKIVTFDELERIIYFLR